MTLAATNQPMAQVGGGFELRHLVFGVLALAFVNGLFLRVSEYVNENGFGEGLLATFNISIVIWVAMWLALDLVRKADFGPTRRLDYVAIGVMLVFIGLPVSALSWVGLTGFSLYFLVTRPGNPSVRATFSVVLALCFSSVWSRMIFRFFMETILRIDTLLVATVTGRPFTGNLINAADGSTTLQVLEACSSFSNMSLAFVGWIVARSYYGTRGLVRSMFFVALSCLAVVTVNTVRIGVIALRPDLYDIAHGTIGANVASLIMTAAIAMISLKGARR